MPEKPFFPVVQSVCEWSKHQHSPVSPLAAQLTELTVVTVTENTASVTDDFLPKFVARINSMGGQLLHIAPLNNEW